MKPNFWPLTDATHTNVVSPFKNQGITSDLVDHVLERSIPIVVSKSMLFKNQARNELVNIQHNRNGIW